MSYSYKLGPFVFVILLAGGCKQPSTEFKDALDYWEVVKTVKAYDNSSLYVDSAANYHRVDDGVNQVLVVTVERNPVFKENQYFTDASSTKVLLIELDQKDSLVNLTLRGMSRFYRQKLAFSPSHGISSIPANENLSARRINQSTWEITSAIQDFTFRENVDFLKFSSYADTTREN